MAINKITATEGNWLFNGEGFAKEVSGFGDLSKWQEVTDDFKTQWEAEHANPGIEGGGENINNEWELLCDLTTTEYSSGVKWTQGDNGQVFDDYKEIFIKMMLQPTENTVTSFRMSIEKAFYSWYGKYGMGAGSSLNFPKSTEKTILCFIRLWKTINGIEQEIRNSANAVTLTDTIFRQYDGITVNNFNNKQINSPDQLPDISFPKHFEEISIGSYVANMPPNCRFMIYGIK